MIRQLLHRRGRAVAWLLLADYATYVGSFMVALYFRTYAPGLNIVRWTFPFFAPEALFVLLYSFVPILLGEQRGLYLRRTWHSRWLHAILILETVSWTLLGYVLLQTLTKLPFLVPSRRVLGQWYVLALSGMALHRLIVFPRLIRWAQERGWRRRVVLLGLNPTSIDIVRKWQQNPEKSTFEPVGFLTDKEDLPSEIPLPVLGHFSELERLVPEHNIEGAIICDPDVDHETLMEMVEQCVRLFGWVDVHSSRSQVWHTRPGADLIFDVPFARVGPMVVTPVKYAMKRAMDIILSVLGLIVLSPVILTIALLIKATSPGPVFYVQTRIGRGGRPFRFYKFRSMYVGADQDPKRKAAILEHIQSDTKAKKVVNEAMITPVGRFIRAWGLDEIPQLWNVLKGDMSLVGPRPLPPEEYEAQKAWQKERFRNVLPGCVGLWKIAVDRHEGLTFADTALYDLYYVRNMTLALDLYVLIQTALIILSRRADSRA